MFIPFAAYFVAHLAAYVLWLRRLTLLHTEKGIFLYHFSSAVLIGLLAIAAAFIYPKEFGLSGCILVLSVHGIYSLSFLELWSLAQGGYSLSIIAGIAQAKAAGTEPDFMGLAAIGLSKQADRIATMERLSLIEITAKNITLTSRGQAIAAIMHLLRRWVDPSEYERPD
jgi:hypothetical protein